MGELEQAFEAIFRVMEGAQSVVNLGLSKVVKDAIGGKKQVTLRGKRTKGNGNGAAGAKEWLSVLMGCEFELECLGVKPAPGVSNANAVELSRRDNGSHKGGFASAFFPLNVAIDVPEGKLQVIEVRRLLSFGEDLGEGFDCVFGGFFCTRHTSGAVGKKKCSKVVTFDNVDAVCSIEARLLDQGGVG